MLITFAFGNLFIAHFFPSFPTQSNTLPKLPLPGGADIQKLGEWAGTSRIGFKHVSHQSLVWVMLQTQMEIREVEVAGDWSLEI